MKKKYWMKVTPDDYQFPLLIADSAQELAALTGASINTITSTASHLKHGRQKHGSYVSTEIEVTPEEMETMT